MKSIICTILAGCFLLGAVALHAYMTPVFCTGSTRDGPSAFVFVSQYGHTYLVDRAEFIRLTEAHNSPTSDAFDAIK